MLDKHITRPPSIAETPRAKEIAAMVEEWYTEFDPQMHSNSVPIKTSRLFREFQHFINDETIVVVDAGGSSYWSPAHLELAPENQALYPRGAAAIGSAPPMALGAQLAALDIRVICISGDGGFGYNINGLPSLLFLRCLRKEGRFGRLYPQLLQKRLGLLEIGGVKALGEPVVDGAQQIVRLNTLALLLPKPTQAQGRPQL
jgi:hypothetical protein